jgi:cell division septation protein DedD
MKRNILIGLALIATITLAGCKSSENSYRKAYEKAKALEMTEAKSAQPVAVTPVQPVTTPVQPVTPADNSDLRSERLNVMAGGILRAFNIVCGSFRSLDNANNLRNTLVSRGYNAQVAQNPETGMYRVIAASFDDRAAAINARNDLRAAYPDSWLLLRTY